MSHTAKMARALEAASVIDFASINRIERKSARHLRTLPPERVAALRAEWPPATEQDDMEAIVARAEAEWFAHTGEGILS